jgi:hypothetical protein
MKDTTNTYPPHQCDPAIPGDVIPATAESIPFLTLEAMGMPSTSPNIIQPQLLPFP